MLWLAPPARQAFQSMTPIQSVQKYTQPRHASPRHALTSAAFVVDDQQRSVSSSYSGWQNEVWGFYRDLGEFRKVVDWKASVVSRIRLRAAQTSPDTDEPTIVDTGEPAEVVNQLSVASLQTQIMKDLSVQLSVPGECWLLGEGSTWRVCSSEEIRAKGYTYEVIDERSTEQSVIWRPVQQESIVVRVWNPDAKLRYRADSKARSALNTLRELELVSRHMQAQYLSRLASAGVFIIPQEVALPSRPEFADAPDPFVREWIETAAESLRTPGTAASVVPIPMRVPAEYVESFKHIDFTLTLDDKIVEKRDSIINRLALQLDAPPEIMLGVGDTNHWSAWQMDESSIKAFILPTAEMICAALTVGYLHPMLRASGLDETELSQWVVWYDASEITIKPDRSSSAKDAYDRLELSGEALRRESGFDEDDAPDDEELKQMILKLLARQPQNGFTALDEIIGRSVVRQAQTQPQEQEMPQDGTPMDGQDTEDEQTADDRRSAPTEDQTRERLRSQAAAQHYLRVTAFGELILYHPKICVAHQFSCPFTVAMYQGNMAIRPGASALYAVSLDSDGMLRFGSAVTRDMSAHVVTMMIDRAHTGIKQGTS